MILKLVGIDISVEDIYLVDIDSIPNIVRFAIYAEERMIRGERLAKSWMEESGLEESFGGKTSEV